MVPEVSIVVPVYRNAETLLELHRRVCHAMESQPLTFEVLFVDDASPDGSLSLLQSLAERDSRVAVLALRQNVGQHRAVLTGLVHALGEWTVVLDADLQDPPEAIPALLNKAYQEFAAVFAGRRGHYESHFRRFTSHLFKRLLHLLCGVPGDAGVFVALSRPMVECLLGMNGPNPSVVAMIGCTRLPLTSVPVERAKRPIGTSAYSFNRRLKSGLSAMAWVFNWKVRAIRNSSRSGFAAPAVRAYVGARFSSTKQGG